MNSGRSRRSGIVLVLVAGLVGLFLLVAASFLSMGSLARGRSDVRAASVAARLAAGSGMDYAASRLPEGSCPAGAVPMVTRGDDWVFREGAGAGIGTAANPSYSHGEPWNDTDSDGVFDTGESWTDRDGNGRFSAASGRVRGAAFGLKIASAGGKMPINAGYLDSLDRPAAFGGPGNGIPDHRDPDGFPYHRGLVHALNNLGAIVRPGSGWTRRPDCASGSPAGTGHAFRFSWLGADLLANRPAGGYPSLAAVRATLKGLGYRDDECDLFEPFLDPGPYETPAETGRAGPHEVADWPSYAPVHLAAAPHEVLASLWMYLTSTQIALQVPYGEPEGGLKKSSRTGSAPLSFGPLVSNASLNYIIFPDEAEALADRVEILRAGGAPFSWKALRADFCSRAHQIFLQDFTDLAFTDPAAIPPVPATPIYQTSWVQAKADLAFQAVALDPIPWAGLHHGSAVWSGWGVDRFADDPLLPWTIGVQQSSTIGFDAIVGPPQPVHFGDPLPPLAPFNPAYAGPFLMTQGGTLAPPVRYRIQSAGRLADASAARVLVEGEFRTAEILTFASQEDFENLSGGAGLAARGITVYDPDPAARHDPTDDDMGTPGVHADDRTYPRIVTIPRPNRRAYFTPASQLAFPAFGYSRLSGAVGLASRQTGLRGARLYWAVKDDFDGRLDNDLNGNGIPEATEWTPGPSGDFWHEFDASVHITPPKFPLIPYSDETGLMRNPWHAALETGTPPTVDFPGMDGAGGPLIGEISTEFWITRGGSDQSFTLQNDYMSFLIEVSSGMSDGTDPQCTRIDLAVGGSEDPLEILAVAPVTTSSWKIPVEAAGGTGDFSNFHVLVTLQPDPVFLASQTLFTVYVNGQDDAGFGPMIHRHSHRLQAQTFESLTRLRGIDEIRLYDHLVTPDPLAIAWRFVPRGTFTSPVYVFDAPARLDRTQWTGLVPPRVAAAGIDPFTIRVEGYTTAPGDPGHPAPAWPPFLLGSPGLVEKLPVVPVKSFRYTVGIDCSAVADTLDDTPVFESVWFTLRRGARPARWTAWTE